MKEVYEQRYRNIDEKKSKIKEEKILLLKEGEKLQRDF